MNSSKIVAVVAITDYQLLEQIEPEVPAEEAAEVVPLEAFSTFSSARLISSILPEAVAADPKDKHTLTRHRCRRWLEDQMRRS